MMVRNRASLRSETEFVQGISRAFATLDNTFATTAIERNVPNEAAVIGPKRKVWNERQRLRQYFEDETKSNEGANQRVRARETKTTGSDFGIYGRCRSYVPMGDDAEWRHRRSGPLNLPVTFERRDEQWPRRKPPRRQRRRPPRRAPRRLRRRPPRRSSCHS